MEKKKGVASELDLLRDNRIGDRGGDFRGEAEGRVGQPCGQRVKFTFRRERILPQTHHSCMSTGELCCRKWGGVQALEGQRAPA